LKCSGRWDLWGLTDEGLPGLAFSNKKAISVHNLNERKDFQRGRLLNKKEINSAFVFPILIDNEVVSIFEFFSYGKEHVDKAQLEVFDIIGERIGQVFERTLSHEKLEKYSKELKKSNEALNEFTYIASHDLKEPLRGISNFSTFLMEDYFEKLDDAGKQKLKTLQDLSKRMVSLIDNLLVYSRVGRVNLAIKKSDINEIVNEKLTFIDSFIKEKNAKIIILKKLPVVKCDEARIGEVFQNLITNAIKYNKQKDKKIEIDYTEDDEQYVFSVKDNGIGIPEDQQPEIFKIFKRLHGKNEYGGGTGAGMSIVKRIVERHGGEIWINSAVDIGTTFYFSIKKFNNIEE